MNIDFLIQAVSEYRYFAMFGILFVSAMGVPIPEEPLLIASGLSVGWGDSQYHLAVAACVAGLLAGDMWVYFPGRRGGRGGSACESSDKWPAGSVKKEKTKRGSKPPHAWGFLP